MRSLPPHQPLPHVVVVALESTAWWATSMGGQPPEQTPTLTRLSGEGALFTNARTMVTHTTQSQFTLLTGITSNLEGDFVEAVMVEPPYESLATVLSASGYRSRFCQMVRATYECNPGLVANLGFDDFWAREDYGDRSAHLGYLAGDDFKMIGPAFEWLNQQKGPCLLLFMTSVAHHPYEVPRWFGPPLSDPQEDYLQAVRYSDAFVKQVVDELHARDVYDQTLLCVIADHGEGFGRHDIYLHNEDPYDEALRVPWILNWPGRIEPARVIDEPCSMIDVTPTILSLLGFDTSRAGFEGVDALAPHARARRLPFAGWSPTYPAGIVHGQEKIIYWPSLDEAYQYQLSSDPNETAPVKLPEEAKTKIRQELASWRLRSRISFAQKRYRQRLLYDRWQTSCLGNTAWCFYVPHHEGKAP